MVAAIVFALLGFLLLTSNAPQTQQQKSPNADANLQKSVKSNYPSSVQDALRQNMNAPKEYVLKSIHLGVRGASFGEQREQPQMVVTDAMFPSNPKLNNLMQKYLPGYNQWKLDCERIGVAECEENNQDPPASLYEIVSPDEYNTLKAFLKPIQLKPLDLDELKGGPVGRFLGTFVTYNKDKFLFGLYTTWDFPNVKEFNFDKDQSDSTPSYLKIGMTGSGTKSTWAVKRDPSAPSAPNVLAQTADEAVDFHFPYALTSDERFGDFAVSVKLRTISGRIAQSAGIIFRFVDSDNYYVLTADPKKNAVILYKYVEGKRLILGEGAATVSANEWHTMKIVAVGNQMKLYFDGRLLSAAMMDTTFKEGMIGVWTQADSVSYFDDLIINN